MENLAPAGLLRFLEEEATTLRLMHPKIRNQLHCLQVEEELFSRQLKKLQKESPTAIASGQNGEDVNEIIGVEENPENEVQSKGVEQESSTLLGPTEKVLGSSPTPKQLPLLETETSLARDKQGVSEIPAIEENPADDHEAQSGGVEQGSSTPLGLTEEVVGSCPTPRAEKSLQGDRQDTSTRNGSEGEQDLQTEVQRGLHEQEISPQPQPSAAPPRVKKCNIRKKTTGGHVEKNQKKTKETNESIEIEAEDDMAAKL